MIVVQDETEANTVKMTETEVKIVTEKEGTATGGGDEIGQDQEVGTEIADETEAGKGIGVGIEVPHHLDNRRENESLCGTGLQ